VRPRLLVRKLLYGQFKPGTFFVSSIILPAKHELTSKATSKSVLLNRSLNTKTNKASDGVSKRHQQLQRDHDIGRGAISGQVAIFFLGGAGNSDHLSKQQ